jgi:hypothetical protein
VNGKLLGIMVIKRERLRAKRAGIERAATSACVLERTETFCGGRRRISDVFCPEHWPALMTLGRCLHHTLPSPAGGSIMKGSQPPTPGLRIADLFATQPFGQGENFFTQRQISVPRALWGFGRGLRRAGDATGQRRDGFWLVALDDWERERAAALCTT